MLKSSRNRQADHGLSSRFLHHAACLAAALFVFAGCGGGSDLPETQLSNVQSSPSLTSAAPVAPVQTEPGQGRMSVSPAPVMSAVDAPPTGAPASY
ncbi:hypothetical protein [Noviherbaspirillum sp.]|uniref:hypothetical protein n=1 Tax=Noviherbaspirillum sp. TaxID=1926288 RepID=UPI002B46810F|nr:hypothetical protein [Noviherbaspirillum sp.]HJV79652.1 hypothetical protein [Noviherbaspirillum sp.]